MFLSTKNINPTYQQHDYMYINRLNLKLLRESTFKDSKMLYAGIIASHDLLLVVRAELSGYSDDAIQNALLEKRKGADVFGKLMPVNMTR